MSYRMTVVLEYPNVDAAPLISSKTLAKELGDGEVVAVQFSDALRMLGYLELRADPELVQQAWREATSASDEQRYKAHVDMERQAHEK